MREHLDTKYFTEIKASQLKFNPFNLIQNHGMLITAGDEELANSMMSNWGLMGVAMNRKVVELLIHPQRYTREFLDKQSHFTISLFDKEYRDSMIFFGTHSGRHMDKYIECDFHLDFFEGIPYIRESSFVLICRKLYVDQLRNEAFTDPAVNKEHREEGDYRYRYVAEIEHILQTKQAMQVDDDEAQ